MQRKILLIEDNEDIAHLLIERLEKKDFSVKHIKNGLDVVSHLMKKEIAPHAIILDLMLPGRTGYELLGTVKSACPYAKVFIFSAHREYQYQMPPEIAENFFCKTDGFDKLIDAIESAVV